MTKYGRSWEKDRLWLGPVKDDVFKSHRKARQANVLTKQNGTNKLKQHEKSARHVTAMEIMPSQSSVVSVNGSLQLSKSPIQERLSIENQVARAEVFQAFHVVAATHSFSLINENYERFKCMFPDSKIYSQVYCSEILTVC